MNAEFILPIVIAAAEQDSVTLLATLAAILGPIGLILGALGGLYLARANRRRLDAQSQGDQATARRTDAEVPFIGSVYVRDLSEAAAALVSPLQQENARLRARLEVVEEATSSLRDKIAALEAENAAMAIQLHDAKERLTTDARRYERQLQDLMLRMRSQGQQ